MELNGLSVESSSWTLYTAFANHMHIKILLSTVTRDETCVFVVVKNDDDDDDDDDDENLTNYDV